MYPNQAGYQKLSQTSKNAAEAMDKTGRRISLQTYVFTLAKASQHGVTIFEVADIYRATISPRMQNGTISARFSELELLGVLEKTNKTRLNQASNREGFIYYWTGKPIPASGAPSKPRKYRAAMIAAWNKVKTLASVIADPDLTTALNDFERELKR